VDGLVGWESCKLRVGLTFSCVEVGIIYHVDRFACGCCVWEFGWGFDWLHGWIRSVYSDAFVESRRAIFVVKWGLVVMSVPVV
jgi:hypothetical protein